MLKQPSPRYEPQIQQVMNDEGYKLSNEAYELDLDTLIQREVHKEEEKNGIHQSIHSEPIEDPAHPTDAKNADNQAAQMFQSDSSTERTQKMSERKLSAKKIFSGVIFTSLAMTFISAPHIIRWLKSKQSESQPIRTDSPESCLHMDAETKAFVLNSRENFIKIRI